MYVPESNLEMGFNTQKEPQNKGVVCEFENKVFALGSCEREDSPLKFIVSSFIEKAKNNFVLLQFKPKTRRIEKLYTSEHTYPATKLKFIPSSNNKHTDLFVSCAEHITLYKITEKRFSDLTTLKVKRKEDFAPPLTSLDWSRAELSWIISSSVDSTCMLWDVHKEKLISQIIAHEKEVYDVCMGIKNKYLFSTCSKDGSIRFFDTRQLTTSTVLCKEKSPIVRLEWNLVNDKTIAAALLNDKCVKIYDLRIPGRAVATLRTSFSYPNHMSWAPKSASHIVTGDSAGNMLVWDVSNIPNHLEDPILSYKCDSSVNNVNWNVSSSKYISLVQNKKMRILKV